MRLLNVHTLELSNHPPDNIPRYAIASHRWFGDAEVSLKDVQKKRNTDKAGYKKVQGFAGYVKEHIPHVEWLWIDTCCINQESSQEVSEAVNSMFRWYANAEVCLAYLADVEVVDDVERFKRSEWFQRGWTLQELLAPWTVLFLTKGWKIIGFKGRTGRGKTGIELQSGPSLATSVVAASGLPERILDNFEQPGDFTIEEKLNWTIGRKTTKEEDMWYCLLGVLGVSMPVIYGEGMDRAKRRLLEETQRVEKEYGQQLAVAQNGLRSQLRPPSRTFLNRIQPFVDQERTLGTRHLRTWGRSRGACIPLCSCICHTKQRLVTPGILHRVLGVLAVNLQGFMSAVQTCSEPTCAGQRGKYADIHYCLPSWAIRRVVIAYCSYTTYGLRFSLRVPVVVEDDSEIMHLVKAGELRAVQRMFERGQATPHCINASWSVPLLNYAVQFHHLELCMLLLSEGANPRVMNRSGISALDRIWGMVLSKSLTSDIEEKFRAAFSLWTESDWVNAQHFQPVHKVVLGFNGQHISAELQSLLTLSAAGIDCRDSKGQTALIWAGIRGDHEAIRVLLSFGADLNLASNTGNTPLLQAARSTSVTSVKYLIEAGANVNWKSRQHFTALHYAIYYRDDGHMIEELIRGGANFESKDSEGWTALTCAAVRNSARSASVLLRNGACIESNDNEGWTPLVHAINQNSYAVLELLLQNHACLTPVTKRMENVLHVASRRADRRTVEILSLSDMDAVDSQLCNTDGQTAANIYANREGCNWEFGALLNSVINEDAPGAKANSEAKVRRAPKSHVAGTTSVISNEDPDTAQAERSVKDVKKRVANKAKKAKKGKGAFKATATTKAATASGPKRGRKRKIDLDADADVDAGAAEPVVKKTQMIRTEAGEHEDISKPWQTPVVQI